MAHGASVVAGTERATSLDWTAVLIESCRISKASGKNGEARIVAKITPPQPTGFGTKAE